MTEPLATSVHAVRISQFQVGDTVVVAGAGPIGLLAIQVLKIGGAGRIIVSQSPGPRRELALQFGADEAVNPRDPDNPVGDQVKAITDGGADVIIECAGVPVSFQQCIDMARPGGQVILVGVNEKETPVLPMGLILGEIQLKGSLAWSHHDFQIAVDMLAAGKIETGPLISETIAMARYRGTGIQTPEDRQVPDQAAGQTVNGLSCRVVGHVSVFPGDPSPNLLRTLKEL